MTKFPFTHRDISWLSFNHRVLQEAMDKSVPIMERIKFLAIYSSNLEEFFKVRVAYVKMTIRVGKKTKKQLDFTPEELLKQLTQIVNQQREMFDRIFNKTIIPELERDNIYLKRRSELSKEQISFIESYFETKMLAFVQPMLLVEQKIRPFLTNSALYLAVQLSAKKNKKDSYAIVKIPSDYLPRFIVLPSKKNRHEVIMIDDIVRHNIAQLFPGYNIQDSFSIKLTRDAELYIDDEYSGDLIEKIKKQLSKRNLGNTTRFIYDRAMPEHLYNFLKDSFSLTKRDMLAEGRYHNNADFFGFPDFGKKHLKNHALPPFYINALETGKTIFEYINEKDRLFNYPYITYDYTVRFFQEAAKDPSVKAISIVQYRVARKSKIMEALMAAAQSGKKVTAFVEVKARFDEEANLQWAQRLESAGVKVLYSFPGLKVHAKLGMIERIENEKIKRYTYLSTGNFHEKTAKLYSDYGLLTSNKGITDEVKDVFNYLETFKKPTHQLKHLLVGQINLRPHLEHLIRQEIKHAIAGKKAYMVLKMNSLEDKQMIELLYEASQAGVKIDLIIRGICCLQPGIKGVSDNIEIISIIDRFLEHTRLFYFYNNGDEQYYLSSADFMRRNLSYRIEVAFPVYDKAARKELKDFLRIQLKDNVKARIIDADNKNEYKKDHSKHPVSAQLETYHYLKRLYVK